jgi:hypothetical protein
VASKIYLDEMRERVGRAIFGADWLGGTDDADWALICSEFGIRSSDRATPDGILALPSIKPCPSKIASKLDRAIGRAARADAQYSTVDTWVQNNGFPLGVATPTERKTFEKALRGLQPPASPAPRKRGPKTGILERVMTEMRTMPRDELNAMGEKEMAFRFNATRERCRAARQRINAEKVIATNSDKKQIPTKDQ